MSASGISSSNRPTVSKSLFGVYSSPIGTVLPACLQQVHNAFVDHQNVMVTGASGYIGGRLVPALIDAGYQVNCLSRYPHYVRGKLPQAAQLHKGDLLELASLQRPFRGCHIAFYLAHALGAATGWQAMEEKMARNFVAAAKAAGVKRLIYLGGLASDHGNGLSDHFQTRLRTGKILLDSGIPTLCFRASIILGPGSLSYDLVTSLVARLPVMIVPKWVQVAAQPIYVDTVIQYLMAATRLDFHDSHIVEIGGKDVVSYLDIMKRVAAITNRRRWFVAVPLLTPRLSSLWLGLVTPIYARIGRKLIDSMKVPSVVTNDAAGRLFPQVVPLHLDKALRLAYNQTLLPSTAWTGAISSGYAAFAVHSIPARRELFIARHRVAMPNLDRETLFRPVREIGGNRGWYFGNVLWVVRGWIDLWLGGVGIRRGRRDPHNLSVGDAVDWWRVESFKDGRYLLLRAEMKVPGVAWLEYKLQQKHGRFYLTQRALFKPNGALGWLYWVMLYPIHQVMFIGMLRSIRRSLRHS